MPATYDSALGTDKDLVRFYLRDVDMAAPRVQDEEIRAMLRRHDNAYMAAAFLIETVYLGGTRGLVRKTVADTSLEWSLDFWRGQASRLRALGQASYQIPTAGGLSAAEKLADEQDADLLQPYFTTGMGGHPSVPPPPPGGADAGTPVVPYWPP